MSVSIGSEITQNQNLLQKQLHIQQLAINSKAGSRKGYEDLMVLAKTETSAQAAAKEVELWYDADYKQFRYNVLGDAISHQKLDYPTDEVILTFHISPDLREGAANVLSELKTKTSVATLCQSLDTEDNLLLTARVIRAINIITDNQFKPLDIQAVLAWWKIHSNDSEYVNPYQGLIVAANMPMTSEVALQDAIKILDSTITGDPGALYSICMKGGLLAILGKRHQG